MKCISALVLIAGLAVWGCNGPTSPEEEPDGPGVVISLDSVVGLPGSSVTLPLRFEYMNDGMQRLDTLGSMDLAVVFDPAVLSFLGGVQQGEVISEWEYFTYRTDTRILCADGDCVRIRIVALRDMDNHAPVVPHQGFPNGHVSSLSFQVTSDWNFVGTTTRVRFLSTGCGDNTLTPQSENHTYYMADDRFGPDSDDAAIDTMACARRDMFVSVLEFRGGSVTIEEPPARQGDVNLDGEAFTTIDFHVFVDLFYKHASALRPSLIPYMLARADCNEDGQALTFADFEYLFRAAFIGLDTSASLPPPYGESVHLELQPAGVDWLIGGTSTSDVSGLDLKIIDPSGGSLDAEWIGQERLTFSLLRLGDTLRIVASPDFGLYFPPILEGDWAPPIRITTTGEERPVIVAAQASMAPGVLMEVVLEP